MREFFKGWRRKAGCIALLMGLVACAGWIRSCYLRDEIVFVTGRNTYERLTSVGQCLTWFHGTSTELGKGTAFAWRSTVVPGNTSEPMHSDLEDAELHCWRFLGLDFGYKRGRITVTYGWTETVYVVPYWCLAAPFTLLSAYLILWQPRPKE